MPLTVAQYWSQHKASSLQSLNIGPAHGFIECYQQPDGLMGAVDASATFPMGSRLEIWEDVEIVNGTPHRRKYSYHLQPPNDRDWIRFDYDPVLVDEMRFHINRPGGIHTPDEWRSLKDVIRMCWQLDSDTSLSGADLP